MPIDAAADPSRHLTRDPQRGRVAVPILLWMAGVPFILVVFLWLLFFRGH